MLGSRYGCFAVWRSTWFFRSFLLCLPSSTASLCMYPGLHMIPSRTSCHSSSTLALQSLSSSATPTSLQIDNAIILSTPFHHCSSHMPSSLTSYILSKKCSLSWLFQKALLAIPIISTSPPQPLPHTGPADYLILNNHCPASTKTSMHSVQASPHIPQITFSISNAFAASI